MTRPTLSSRNFALLIPLCLALAPNLAAAKERIGFEWGVNVTGGGQELGVTTKKGGKFDLLHEKSTFCILIGAGPAKSVCLTPDVYTSVTTASLSGLGQQTFNVQEFEVVSEAADWDAAGHWTAAAADVDLLAASVSHLCQAHGAVEPAIRPAPQHFQAPPDTNDTAELTPNDRCFVPYTALRKYLGTRHVMVEWETMAKDTEGGAIPGVFVKIKNGNAWTYSAGAQATVDVSLEKLSNANVVTELFDGDHMGLPYQPPAVGTATQLQRQNLARMLWHIVLAKAALRAIPNTTPGGRKDTYRAYQKTVIGKIWTHVVHEDQVWIASQFVKGNVAAHCPDALRQWMEILMPNSSPQTRLNHCNAAFDEVKGDFDQGAAANPASVPQGKDKGPVVGDGHIIVMMELRNTQPIPVNAGLLWDNGHLRIKNQGQLSTHLGRLYP